MGRRKKKEADTMAEAEKKEKTPEEQYLDDRDAHRNATPRHVLKLEADMDEDVKRKVALECNQIRIAGNKLTGIMEKRVNDLFGRKAYKDLLVEYGKLSEKITRLTGALRCPEKLSQDELEKKEQTLKETKEALEAVKEEMKALQEECNVTWEFTRKQMQQISNEMHLHSVFSLTRAEDVWKGVEAILYRDGEHLNFNRKGDLPVLRAKQENRGVPIHVKKGQLAFTVTLPASRQKIQMEYAKRLDQMDAERAEKGITQPLTQHEKEMVKVELKRTLWEKYPFSLIVKKGDLFAEEEISRIIDFMNDPEAERRAVAEWKETGVPQETFRPCYASLVCETIRGKLRVYCCISIEGNALPKKNKDGSPRHTNGTGVMGVDFGPQSVETVTLNDATADNLAERNGRSTFESEKKQKQIQRAMDRSCRATNPQNFNPDGTIRKGKKHWNYSNRYKKLKRRYHELCRKNAASRKYAINEMVHNFRARADEVHIEPNNVKAMQRKAKKKDEQKPAEVEVEKPATEARPAESQAPQATSDPVKKNTRRKRFGRSILHRNPGYFYAQLQKLFESTGGKVLVVPNEYRASQYDHRLDTYIKKKLSQRWHEFLDGLAVQRDLYSAFLLLCAKDDLSAPDREKCLRYFDQFLIHHNSCLEQLSQENRTICNIKKKTA